MIRLQPPHMGLNDRRAPVKVRMWNTWTVDPTKTRTDIIDWVAHVASRTPSRRLKHVVFNCHGNAAIIQMGEGFDRRHTGLFSRWRGLVEEIWFRACLVAQIATPNAPAAGDGNLFCSEIAQAARCNVTASTELQVDRLGRTLPYGELDTYEGLVVTYGLDGRIGPSTRNRSTYQTNPASPTSWTYNRG